jgi:hypothetical protein
MSIVEQELLTLPKHLSSTPIFSCVHVTRSSVLCHVFPKRLGTLVYKIIVFLIIIKKRIYVFLLKHSILILMFYICSSTKTSVIVGILWILKNIRWNQRGSAKWPAKEIFCCSSNYGFWLPFWYLQALLMDLLKTYHGKLKFSKFLHTFAEDFLCRSFGTPSLVSTDIFQDQPEFI